MVDGLGADIWSKNATLGLVILQRWAGSLIDGKRLQIFPVIMVKYLARCMPLVCAKR
jgi:hypothetical protein